MVLLEPGEHARKIRDKQRRINRHIENGRDQRQPSLLKSPEVPHGSSHPCVVAAFKGQSARKFPDHERGGKAPEKRGEKQDEDRLAIPSAMHDVFRAIGSARDHKEGGGDERPKRKTDGLLRLVVVKKALGSDGRNRGRRRKVRTCGSCCQFRCLPPQAT